MEFIKKIYTKYVSLNVKDYLGGEFDFEINKVLIFLAVGLCIACVFINYNQGLVSRLLKKLIRLDAFSEDSSKTLKDLGLLDHKPTKSLISKNSGTIKRVLGVVGRKNLTYEEYIAAERAKKDAKKLAKKARLTRNSEQQAPDEEKKNGIRSETDSSELDFSEARFYVIPESRAYAERYVHRDTSPIKTAGFCVLILLFFAALILLMPTLLKAVRGVF